MYSPNIQQRNTKADKNNPNSNFPWITLLIRGQNDVVTYVFLYSVQILLNKDCKSEEKFV